MVARGGRQGRLERLRGTEAGLAERVDRSVDRVEVADREHLATEDAVGDPRLVREAAELRPVVRLGSSGLLLEGLDPGNRLGRVGDRHEADRADARRGRIRDIRDRDVEDGQSNLPPEPGLDVRPVVTVAIRRAPDEPVERLVELRFERRLVGESREMRQELAEPLLLVAGQVEAGLGVEERIGRRPRGDRRGGVRPAGEEVERGRGDASDEHDHEDRHGPAESTARASRARRGGRRRGGDLHRLRRRRGRRGEVALLGRVTCRRSRIVGHRRSPITSVVRAARPAPHGAPRRSAAS